MLPDFPKQKSQMNRLFELQVEIVRSTSSPLLSQAHVSIRHEGHRLRLHREDGTIEDTTPHEFSGEVSFATEELKEMPFEAVLHEAANMGRNLAKQQAQAMYGDIADVAKEAGTQLDAGGRPFHPEIMLELFEKMLIEFDQDGNPQMPALVVHPKLAEVIKQKAPEWEADPCLKARWDQTIRRKKEEWRAREARRRLVD